LPLEIAPRLAAGVVSHQQFRSETSLSPFGRRGRIRNRPAKVDEKGIEEFLEAVQISTCQRTPRMPTLSRKRPHGVQMFSMKVRKKRDK